MPFDGKGAIDAVLPEEAAEDLAVLQSSYHEVWLNPEMYRMLAEDAVEDLEVVDVLVLGSAVKPRMLSYACGRRC